MYNVYGVICGTWSVACEVAGIETPAQLEAGGAGNATVTLTSEKTGARLGTEDLIMMTEWTYEISDIDGRNRRTVTLAQYRAEVDAAKARVRPVVDALRRGDLAGCARAQAALRKARRT